MGLWLVNWIVRESDGDITVVDNDPEGTTVAITLPRNPESTMESDPEDVRRVDTDSDTDHGQYEE